MHGTRLMKPVHVDSLTLGFKLEIPSSSVPIDDFLSIIQQLSTQSRSVVQLLYIATSEGKRTIAFVMAERFLKPLYDFYIHPVNVFKTTKFLFNTIVSRLKMKRQVFEQCFFHPQLRSDIIHDDSEDSQVSDLSADNDEYEESFINDQHQSSHSYKHSHLVIEDSSQQQVVAPKRRLRKLMLVSDSEQDPQPIQQSLAFIKPQPIIIEDSSSLPTVYDLLHSFTHDDSQKFVGFMRTLLRQTGYDGPDCFTTLEQASNA